MKITDGMMWDDIVRDALRRKSLSDAECITYEKGNDLLWRATCYPFGTPDLVVTQLREACKAGCKTVGGALQFAEDALVAAMDCRTAPKGKA